MISSLKAGFMCYVARVLVLMIFVAMCCFYCRIVASRLLFGSEIRLIGSFASVGIALVMIADCTVAVMTLSVTHASATALSNDTCYYCHF
jgi:hypothetical protein